MVHANGISRPRTVRRLPTENKWRADLIEKATTAPWGEDQAKEEDDHESNEPRPAAESIPLEPGEDILPEQQVIYQYPAVKSIYLRRADFQVHGWTEGCQKCMFMLLHPGR